MPQHAKGPRLYRRKDTGIYLIRDTGRGERSTGTRDRREAERALASYIVERDRPHGPATPEQMTVSTALTLYAKGRAAKVRDPARIGYAISALLPFWGSLPISGITEETCDAYARQRMKVRRYDRETGKPLEYAHCAPGTIRKELGTLKAAMNWCRRKGHLVNPPEVYLPPKPEPNERWLTRSEAARLLWAAWRNPKSRHLARFILVALYTGTRKTAILRLHFMPNASGGWVDTKRGVMYRRAPRERETKKKRPTIPVPPRLLAHLRRWEREGSRWVVSFDGAGVGSIKTAWNTAIQEAGLAATGVTPHTLRHTAITWAMQTGKADAWELAGFFGVSPETMQRVYAHHHPDFQKDALQAVSAGGRKL